MPRGGGRGRGMTLPAWMTQGGAGGAAAAAAGATCVTPAAVRASLITPPTHPSSTHGVASEKPTPSDVSRGEDAPADGGGGPAGGSGQGAAFIRGTGRGRGRGGGRGRGRGRGGIGANIMAKMGYQEGKGACCRHDPPGGGGGLPSPAADASLRAAGLGRGGRGTTAPLQAVPVGGGQGRIVDRGGATPSRKRAAPTVPPGPAGETNVLLLMVRLFSLRAHVCARVCARSCARWEVRSRALAAHRPEPGPTGRRGRRAGGGGEAGVCVQVRAGGKLLCV